MPSSRSSDEPCGRASFGAALRLRESADFRRVFDADRTRRGRNVILWVADGPSDGWRLGVVASKRTFRRSVDRSRAKRLVREAFRLNRRAFRGAGDLVVVARRAILDAKRQDVEAELLKLMGVRARGAGEDRCAG